MASNSPFPSPFSSLVAPSQEDLKKLKGAWLWLVILGACLILLGMAAIGHSRYFTIATVEIVGVFLIIGAVLYIIGSFIAGSWGGFFLTLVTGILQLFVGVMCVRHPAEAAIVYTILMAVFFMV